MLFGCPLDEDARLNAETGYAPLGPWAAEPNLSQVDLTAATEAYLLAATRAAMLNADEAAVLLDKLHHASDAIETCDDCDSLWSECTDVEGR